MINYIEGKIIKNSENKVLILNNGIAYEINCNNVKKVNVKLFIVPIFNDGYTFFGFESYKHKEIFEKLIKIKGIGPKIAFKVVCSSGDGELSFDKIIRIKGVSSRKAEDIISGMNIKKNPSKLVKELKSLGFDEVFITHKLDNIDLSKPDEEIVKEFLK